MEMDIRNLGKTWVLARREGANADRLHPAEVIKMPLAFPFVITPAKTTIDGRNLRQRPRTLMEATPHAVDARQLSEEFQRLRSEADLVRFLNHYGWWDGRRNIPVEQVWDFQEWLQLILKGSNEFRAKQLSPRGLFRRLPGLLARKFMLSFAWNHGCASFTVETNCCLDAITATVLIDVIRQTRYTECKRADCELLFPEKPGKDYCCQKCQHLEVMRRKRRPKGGTPKVHKGLARSKRVISSK